MKNPMQPFIEDGRRIIRFKSNKIVEAVFEAAREGNKLDLNDIACQNFTQDDRVQFAQLIGYSLRGFHELSYVPDLVAASASKEARMTFPNAGGCRDDGGCKIHCGVEA